MANGIIPYRQYRSIYLLTIPKPRYITAQQLTVHPNSFSANIKFKALFFLLLRQKQYQKGFHSLLLRID